MADVNSRNFAENKDIVKLKKMQRTGGGVRIMTSKGSLAQYSGISSFSSKRRIPSVQSSIRRKLDTCIVNNYEVSKRMMSKIDPHKYGFRDDHLMKTKLEQQFMSRRNKPLPKTQFNLNLNQNESSAIQEASEHQMNKPNQE